MEQEFLRSEAISAVADEGFMVDEEDDYGDLYSDVNVDVVFQSFNRVEDVQEETHQDLGFRDDGAEKKIEGFCKEEEKGVVVADQKLGFGGDKSVEVVEQRPVVVEGCSRMSEACIDSTPVEPAQRSLQQSHGVGNGGGGTVLFVGDLHWWTTDAELETELCKYGHVKEVKFFDEKASGKSKGYCQVEFYDASAAAACKEGMSGHIFNGKPCVVQYTSPFSIKRMGEPYSNFPPGGNGVGVNRGRGGGNNVPVGGGYQGGEGNGTSHGRGNWGRGNGQGMGGRGQGGRYRGGMSGGRGMVGNGFGMMGQGFDSSYGPNMGRTNGYGGFPVCPTPPFSGMMPSFPPSGGISMPGVAPHVNPAFFGRGMPVNGMGMMPPTGMDGSRMGMWSDSNSSGWVGEESGGRAAESRYREDAASAYGGANRDRGGAKDRMSNRKYWDDRDPDSDRDMPREKDGFDGRELSRERERPRVRDRDSHLYKDDRDHDRNGYREDRDLGVDGYREDRERYMDSRRYKNGEREYDTVDHPRYKDRQLEYDDELDDDELERGRSSRVYSKPRLYYEEEYCARSMDVEYSKRGRLQ